MTLKAITTLSYLVTFTACAGAKHVAMPRSAAEFAAADKCERGIRYYESSLYLLIHSDAKGNIESKFLHLPDPSKPMAVRPQAFLATLESTFEFENGVLTASDADGDETVIPKAVVAAAKDVAEAAVDAANRTVGTAESQKVPAPYLFKVVLDEHGVHFRGAQGDHEIQVTRPNKEKK